jgi:methylase of polypeptide subunit release factors
MRQVPVTREQRRLNLQADLDNQKSQPERNRMGQFATPTALAMDVVRQGVALLPPEMRMRFLDPAIGTGAFYSALRHVAARDRIEAAEGFEIDAHYGQPARELWVDTPLKIHLVDFTTVTPPAAEADRFNLIICNPPYVRHHHIPNGEKARLQDASQRACGVRITGLAGLYCYFVALSHPWMAEGGVAGWLIPSEFMDVNYGKAVKRYLLTQVTLLRIHRFDPDDVQFEDALVSSAVVWFRKQRPPAGHSVEFTFGGTLADPKLVRRVPTEVLDTEPKWTRFPLQDARTGSEAVTLGDFFTIKRGLATGANDFFILTPKQIEERNLPLACFRPILPGPRYLGRDEILADEAGNPMIERQLFLLDCRLPEDEIRTRYPALWTYLESGKPHVSERYLSRHRDPWYAQEDRPPAPFLCTYLARRSSNGGQAFRFILNHSRATAANVYLLLYPRPFLAQEMVRDPGLALRIWKLLNETHPETFLEEGRVYGGGLHKLEPRELARVPADWLLALIPQARKYLLRQAELFPPAG